MKIKIQEIIDKIELGDYCAECKHCIGCQTEVPNCIGQLIVNDLEELIKLAE